MLWTQQQRSRSQAKKTARIARDRHTSTHTTTSTLRQQRKRPSQFTPPVQQQSKQVATARCRHFCESAFRVDWQAARSEGGREVHDWPDLSPTSDTHWRTHAHTSVRSVYIALHGTADCVAASTCLHAYRPKANVLRVQSVQGRREHRPPTSPASPPRASLPWTNQTVTDWLTS